MFERRYHTPTLIDEPTPIECSSQPDCDMCPAGAMPLSMVPCDSCVRLIGIQGGRRLRKRMAELGLNPGSTVRVVQRHGHGPMILAVKEDTRMAIGRGMAHKILVTADEEGVL